jgi:hypothetical protein
MVAEFGGSVPGAVSHVTLCETPPLAQVQVTLPPAAIVTLVGLKLFPPLPTVTLAESGAVTAVAVNTTGDPASPFTFAVSVWVPALGPSVRVTEATPVPSVTGDMDETAPPPFPTTQVTVTLALPLPWESLTSTLCGVARALLIEPVWLLPPFSDICVGFPAVAVAAMVSGDPTSPATVATVPCDPAVPPNVRETDAMPLPFVTLDACPTEPPPVTDQVTVTFATATFL